MGKWTDEALRMKPFFQKGAQTLDAAEALEVKGIYAEWEELLKVGKVDTNGKPGYKFTYNGDLYSCVNGDPTFQSDWIPGTIPAVYVRIDETHAGTIDDPKIAARGMDYTYGLYYLDPEDGLTYLCQYGETQGTVTLAYLPHEVPSHFKVVTEA